jgi:hypothetical protein
LKAQVNERSEAIYNNFKELISIQYCTFIILSVVHGGGGGGGGGWGYYFLEFM